MGPCDQNYQRPRGNSRSASLVIPYYRRLLGFRKDKVRFHWSLFCTAVVASTSLNQTTWRTLFPEAMLWTVLNYGACAIQLSSVDAPLPADQVRPNPIGTSQVVKLAAQVCFPMLDPGLQKQVEPRDRRCRLRSTCIVTSRRSRGDGAAGRAPHFQSRAWAGWAPPLAGMITQWRSRRLRLR